MYSWRTAKRIIEIDAPIVMGILNLTPDSFSDGGSYGSVEAALYRVEEMISEGASIIDIGGESTRPGSKRITVEEEIARVVPVVRALAKRFDIPLSVDTSKAAVAQVAFDAGAEIINDISGLRWDPGLAELAARTGSGLVLMHSLGEFETLHSQPPVEDVVVEVMNGLRCSVKQALERGVSPDQLAMDIGIGFGKSPEQNLELIAKIDRLVNNFDGYPLLIGASRKSFIGKLLSENDPKKRVVGSIAVATIAAMNGAMILRVHDVKQTIDALKVVNAVKTFL
ncbi:dihydropteroate synthase [Leptolyngbya sp. 7M]|uniref:dihydropteroate synthase n=1 Tax=Leptolyngbya sp. 7M TaxID=2812896 RepID=UPI001B8D8B59|nr:dihydropteroate synthase [Leptolyngbya sp. 7M]QYO66275.1 dihydropteroate synthase [Leptolyngbya sp. 7M]